MPQPSDLMPLESLQMTTPPKFQVADLHRDPAKFDTIYRAYLDRVYRYILIRVSNPPDAEDLTSQVFLAALEALPGYKERGSFAAWLFSIAQRKVADYFREKTKSVPLDSEENLPSFEADHLSQVIQKEDLQRLVRMISELPENEQELLRLRFAARLSFDEIAIVTNHKTSAVKMAFYRLLDRLENRLEVTHD